MAFVPRINLSGIQATLTALNNVKRAAPEGLRAGMEAMAKNVLNLSRRYCPVETGLLRDSGRVEFRELGTESVVSQVLVVYGPSLGSDASQEFSPGRVPGSRRADAFYAVFVHENLNAYHAPPTQAKFLERAVQESLSGRGQQLVRKYAGEAVGFSSTFGVQSVYSARFERVYGTDLGADQ